MGYINTNFELLILTLAFFLVSTQVIYLFLKKPSSKKKDIILTWLLQIVIEAEKLFKSNTGQVKFSYVYNAYLKQFPIVSKFVPIEVFSELVSKSLIQMKHLIETNKEVKKYIEGDN